MKYIIILGVLGILLYTVEIQIEGKTDLINNLLGLPKTYRLIDLIKLLLNKSDNTLINQYFNITIKTKLLP